MIEKWVDSLGNLLLKSGLSPENANLIEGVIILVVIFILAWLSDRVSSRIIVSSIRAYVKKSKNKWDDIFLTKKVFNRLAHIAPALVIIYTIDYAIDD